MNPPISDAPASEGRRLADVPHSGPSASRPIAGPPVGVRERRDRAMGWRSRDVARSAVVVFGIYVFGRLLWFANSLVFVLFLGTLFGLAVAGAVDRLERFKIRRGIASALIVFGTLAAIIGVGALMAPTLTSQFGELRKQIPTAVDRAERWITEHPNSLISTGLRSAVGTQSAPGAAGQAGASLACRPAVSWRQPAAGGGAGGWAGGPGRRARTPRTARAAPRRPRRGSRSGWAVSWPARPSSSSRSCRRSARSPPGSC
jgi:hypothetical protein